MKPSPLSPYAVSKITCEYLLSVFSKLFTLETVSLRYFNVFGPRQDPKSEYAAVIPRFILALLGGGAPVIYGDGLQSRDFTFVEDVVSANLIACTIAGLKGEAFNIACGKRISLLELLDILYKITGIKVKTVFENARQGDIKHSMADVSMARKCLGFRPGVFLEQGLEKTVSWFRAHMNKERVG
jgi:UDP-glucose 4-epimerase